MKKSTPFLTLFLALSILWMSACSASSGESPTPVLPDSSGAGDTIDLEDPTPIGLTAEADMSASATEQPAQVSPTEAPPAISEPPASRPASLFGIQISGKKLSDQVETATRSGAYWVRVNGIVWHQIEPEEGVFNWNATGDVDETLVQAAEYGLEPILIVRGTPDWAQLVESENCGPIKQDKFPAFAQFISIAVEKYSNPPFNVNVWEIGNEPDATLNNNKVHPYGCWGDKNDAYYGGGYYAEWLKTAYEAIKTADPDAVVLVGGLLLDCDPINPPETSPGSGEPRDCSPSLFMEGVLQAGGGAYFDGISFHAYDFYYDQFGTWGSINWNTGWNMNGMVPVTVAKAGYLKQLLELYGVTGKLLINTETALICGANGNEPGCNTPEFDQVKAGYVVQSFAVAKAEELAGNVWYSLKGWRASQLVAEDFSALDAFTVYQFAIEMLDNAEFVREVPGVAGALVYEFINEGENFWVIWSADAAPNEVALPAVPVAVMDIFGNNIPAAQSMTVGLEPLYIIWGP